MNNLQIYDLEIQLAYARNIYITPMVFEGGAAGEKVFTGGSLDFGQEDLIDVFLSRETESSLVDWATDSFETQ